MSVHYKSRAFVFKTEERGDADKVFSVFTKEYGRVEVVGKSIRKIASKLRGGIELFSISDIEFVQGKNKKTLTDAVYYKEKLKSIARHPEKAEIASQISRLLDDFIKGEQKDEKIFDLVEETFARINAIEPRQLTYYYFFWNFVAFLGYAPDVSGMPQSVASLLALIMRQEWDTLVSLDVPKQEQQYLKEASINYYRYLLEHTT